MTLTVTQARAKRATVAAGYLFSTRIISHLASEARFRSFSSSQISAARAKSASAAALFLHFALQRPR
jgi:hypothetical protein